MLLSGLGAEEVEPLNVYLFARTVGEPLSSSEKKAREKELKAKRDEAKDARKALDKKLKALYGKDRYDWPEEDQEEYRLTKEAETMSRFEYDYLKDGDVANGNWHYLHASVDDITQAIEGKGGRRKRKWISLVRNREQAHLLVEVWDRRHSSSYDHFIAVRIVPAETLISNQLGEIRLKDSSSWRLPREVVHAFREQEPFWIMECKYGSDKITAWEYTAGAVADTINAFIKDNRAVRMGKAPAQ